MMQCVNLHACRFWSRSCMYCGRTGGQPLLADMDGTHITGSSLPPHWTLEQRDRTTIRQNGHWNKETALRSDRTDIGTKWPHYDQTERTLEQSDRTTIRQNGHWNKETALRSNVANNMTKVTVLLSDRTNRNALSKKKKWAKWSH